MDFENHHFSYFFEKQKKTYLNRKVKLSISHKDFHCFEPMGFSHVRVSSNFFSPKTQKKHTREKTYFSEKKNLLKPTKYQHFHLPKSSQKNVIFFRSSNKKKRKKTQTNT